MAQGRDEGRAVRRYLEAIEAQRGHGRGGDASRRRWRIAMQVVTEKLLGRRPAGAPASAAGEDRSPGRAGPGRRRATTWAPWRRRSSRWPGATGCARGIEYNAWRAAGSAAGLQRAGITRADGDGRVAERRGQAGRRPEALIRPADDQTGEAGVAGRRPAPGDSSRPMPSVPPVRASLARSGWGMRPTTLPSSLHTPAMSSIEPWGWRCSAARAVLGAEALEGGGVAGEVALEVVDGELRARSPEAGGSPVNTVRVRAHPHPHRGAQEAQPPVLLQRPGQEPRFGQHLEAVADPHHRPAVGRVLVSGLHHRREARQRAGRR